MLTGVKFYGFIFAVFYFIFFFFLLELEVADQGPSAKIKHCTIKVLQSIQFSSFARESYWLEFIFCLIVICSS